jgi:hypothetical protein
MPTIDNARRPVAQGVHSCSLYLDICPARDFQPARSRCRELPSIRTIEQSVTPGLGICFYAVWNAPLHSPRSHSLQQGPNSHKNAQIQALQNKALSPNLAKPSLFAHYCSTWNNCPRLLRWPGQLCICMIYSICSSHRFFDVRQSAYLSVCAKLSAFCQEPAITYQTKSFDRMPSNASCEPKWKLRFLHM